MKADKGKWRKLKGNEGKGRQIREEDEC